MEVEGQQPISSDSSTEVPGTPRFLSKYRPPPSPFERNCALSEASIMDSGRLDHLSRNQWRDLRKQNGNHRIDAKEVSKDSVSLHAGPAREYHSRSAREFGCPICGSWGKGPPARSCGGAPPGPRVCIR